MTDPLLTLVAEAMGDTKAARKYLLSSELNELAAAALSVIREQERWRPISEAPANTPVQIKVGRGMEFVARCIPDGSMTDEETSCDQWRAEYEDEHPPCWSDGCCWESNADDQMSLQPTHFRPLPAPPLEKM